MKYKRHDLHGLMIFDKPLGITSMEAIRRVRRHAGMPKTGHAGTLDPLATGVLLLCFGKATKSVPALMDMTKVYETTVDLSAFSSTDDAESELTQPDNITPPTLAEVQAALEKHLGDVEQTPPAYSAIKVDGQRAYKRARSGENVEMPTRIVRIDAIELLAYHYPELTLRITCGKGTYIRSLGRQLGEALGTGGYLTMLRRTAIGPYDIERAYSLETLPPELNSEDLLTAPVPPKSK